MNEKKPYIFAHRGAMGYCIENTMPSFQKAVEMKVGLETDIHLTKDKQLVCFHDPGFKIGDKWYKIKNLTLNELSEINFKDGRNVPTLKEVFFSFNHCPKTFRYSCDIGSKKVGFGLINLVKDSANFDQVEITDTNVKLLIQLREYSEDIKLIHTVPYNIIKINSKSINFEILHENRINALNVKYERVNEENFRKIIDNGLKCYCWGVNGKIQMKRVLNLRYKTEFITAIYTNYPDILKKLRDKIFD